MNELALFAGAGGGILGGKLLGWNCVCAVEVEPYPRDVLLARQRDGLLDRFPVWDDVQTFDGKPWRGHVDVISGGFPCQDISIAGKGAGLDGKRSGLWTHMARIIGEVRPRFAFVENSPALVTRGLGRVLGDLAALGYDCRWTMLGAADVGAPHKRDRFWLVGRNTHDRGCARNYGQERKIQDKDADTAGVCEVVANTQRDGDRPQEQRGEADRPEADRSAGWIGRPGWWKAEPDVGRVANGVAARVDRLKALGNGQVPVCAATAWRMLTGGMSDTHNVANNR